MGVKNIRVITFQEREVTNEILNKGIIETERMCWDSLNVHINYNDEYMKNIETCGYKRIPKKAELELTKEHVQLMREVNQYPRKYIHILPFYGYIEHSYCGYMQKISLRLIYNMYSHFGSALEYAGWDIIELDVPENELLEIRKVGNMNGEYIECVMPYLKKEWIVSILKFKDIIEEPIMNENAYLYENEVLKSDVYHMCYSKDIVFTGHGRGDCIEYAMCNKLILSTDLDTMCGNVQSDIFRLFVKYCYIIRHNLGMEEVKNIPKYSIMKREMPNKLNKLDVEAFSVCMNRLIEISNNVKVYRNGTKYIERLRERKENGAW